MATILLIEDEANIRTFVSVNLEVRGYTTLQAEDGTQGLAHLHNGAPDLLILDMMLPDMTGLDILKVMQTDERLRQIPVILMTASANVGSMDNGEKAFPNLVAHLVKPASVRTLIDTVKAVVGA